MTTLLNARILASLGMIVFVAAIVAGSTGAFFSDTETSTGNTFTAGAIDLQIDNTSYVTSPTTGLLVASPNNTWALSNLTNQLFFSFADVKPGDIGEDTISIHAGSNNAWACMAADITATPENTLVDPETDAGDVGPALGDNGELQNFLNFYFWYDDGDNVFETGELTVPGMSGLASTIFDGTWHPIADSQNGTAIPGGSTRYVAKAWCFGTLTPTPLAQDNASSTPLVRGTGFTCDGSGSNNVAQTDGIVVDVSFQAVQTRNNAAFLCTSLPTLQGLSVHVTRDNETTIGTTDLQPNMDDNTLVISTKEHYGVHADYTGPLVSGVNWKITIAGPVGFNPQTQVDLQEEGYEDGLNPATIAVEQYNFDAGGVAEGSVFDLDPDNDFDNVDSLHFLAGAPAGQYTITRTLIDDPTNTPLSNTLVMVVTLN